jgi:hypothetical protein
MISRQYISTSTALDDNGIQFGHRRVGGGTLRSLMLLRHFGCNLDRRDALSELTANIDSFVDE